MKLIRELRLLPVVLFATVCLLALRVLGVIVDDRGPLMEFDPRSSSFEKSATSATGDPLGGRADHNGPRGKAPWATEMFNYPDVTGSLAAEKQAEKNAAKSGGKVADKSAGQTESQPPQQTGPTDPANATVTVVGGKLVPLHPTTPVPPGERALLERLQERRQELDARSRELEIRESLLKAAEQQIELRMGELKQIEDRIHNASQKKDETEAQRLKGLVTMYESMRAKDAAKIFDRLELRVLIEVASQINPRRMSDILALMQPESAERLTVELANRANAIAIPSAPRELPKIEGRPKPN